MLDFLDFAKRNFSKQHEAAYDAQIELGWLALFIEPIDPGRHQEPIGSRDEDLQKIVNASKSSN